MKALAALGIAVAALALAPAAHAQTRVMQPHEQTASALRCLVAHGKDCEHNFRARAVAPSRYWLLWTPAKDLTLGPLLSSTYVGTEPVNTYLTRFLHSEVPDVYDVRFQREKMTFYIVPPGDDGNIRYLLIRHGTPDDENRELFVSGPG